MQIASYIFQENAKTAKTAEVTNKAARKDDKAPKVVSSCFFKRYSFEMSLIQQHYTEKLFIAL